MDILIRCERNTDHRRVEKMTRESFWDSNKLIKDQIGATEHYLVHLLRKSIVIRELDLVAEYNGDVIGHVMVSNQNFVVNDETKIEVLCLGPLTVDVKFQRQGVGHQLMKEVIARAKKTDYPGIILYGHPEYYPRFGFINTKVFGITTSDGDYIDALMALELKEDGLKNIQGRFNLNPIFDEQSWLSEALQFDRAFDE